MRAMQYDEQAEMLRPVGALQPFGEEGFSTLERVWLRPTLEFVGVSGEGEGGEGVGGKEGGGRMGTVWVVGREVGGWGDAWSGALPN
jgi:hypothetical protein